MPNKKVSFFFSLERKTADDVRDLNVRWSNRSFASSQIHITQIKCEKIYGFTGCFDRIGLQLMPTPS